MIGRDEIDSVARDLQVNAADVERDYVFGWLLANLFGQSRLRDRLVLKGGNALRKGYFENTRYSDDLDFTTSGSVSVNELRNELLAICNAASAGSGVTFLNDEAVVQEKRRIDEQLQVLEARLYFRDFYGKQGHVRVKVRIDVTQFERLHLPAMQRPLLHGYSDASSCHGTITCVKLEEILASKLKCLLQRRHVADLFDYVHWLFFGSESVDTRLVISTFLHKTIYSRQPSAALELLLNLPLQILRDAWTKYIVCPARAALAFETALGRFAEHVRSIFAPFGATDRAWFSRRVFFPSALRNVILDAGSRLTLVKMKYQGVERLVEPYSLRYKQKKDGDAREYFYGFDRTGGRSSGPQMKSFVADGFQSAEPTDISFEPQYDVEVSKAGDLAVAGRFVSRRAVPGFGVSRRRGIPGPIYTFRCSLCHRLFAHRTFDPTLRAHSNGRGSHCVGSTGVYIGTRW